jgi:hypothetical protein
MFSFFFKTFQSSPTLAIGKSSPEILSDASRRLKDERIDTYVRLNEPGYTAREAQGGSSETAKVLSKRGRVVLVVKLILVPPAS